MAKKGSIVFFLSFIVAVSTLVTFQFPASPQLRQSHTTEIVLQNEEAIESPTQKKEYQLSGRYNVLRWHNHTINLHLRNVRSRWLTFTTPAQHLPVTYPEEESRI